MIVVSLGGAGYLVATGQAGTVDGLFLVVTALLIALCFVIYVGYMIRRAMEAAKPAPQTAKGRRCGFRRQAGPRTELEVYCLAGVAAFFGVAAPPAGAAFFAGAAVAGGGP